jgi:hypothetical protein
MFYRINAECALVNADERWKLAKSKSFAWHTFDTSQLLILQKPEAFSALTDTSSSFFFDTRYAHAQNEEWVLILRRSASVDQKSPLPQNSPSFYVGLGPTAAATLMFNQCPSSHPGGVQTEYI